MELVTVGKAYKLAVTRSLKVQTPEPEEVGAAHGLPLGRHLVVNHHRDCW
jgi:hypothetical protein